MARRWIEDDPLDDGVTVLVEPSGEPRGPGVATVLGVGSAAVLFLVLVAAIALID